MTDPVFLEQQPDGCTRRGLEFDVRKYDRERFVTTLFAAADRRDDLLTLYAFNAEVARIKSLVQEPLAGAIRLQWWRDVLTQDRPAAEIDGHPIAAPLTRLLETGRMTNDLALAMLDAREAEVNKHGFGSLAQMVAHVDATAGNLSRTALQVLGVDDPASIQAARGTAIAYGLVGLVRSLTSNLSYGWQVLPQDLWGQGAITSKTDLSGPVRKIAEQAQTTLDIARQSSVQRPAVAVCLLGTLAQGHLRMLRKTGWNPFVSTLTEPQTMPLRLAWHAVRGRF